MSEPDFRRHPVARMLDNASMGQIPSEGELDDLRLPPETRRRVAEAAKAAADTKSEGLNKAAHEQARTDAKQIIDGLAPEKREPDYLEERAAEPSDPEGLAKGVQRW